MSEADDDVANSEGLGNEYDADENSDGDHVAATGSKLAQRTIPSWEEAIGFIVDTNMQSRSQRRPTSRSQSRGPSSHGRSRGRRKN
jgi:hypothetical protein